MPLAAAQIDVVVPTFNPRVGHLEALLGSIARQTVQPRAVFVIDDSSNEVDVEARVRQSCSLPLNIAFRRQPRNVGMVENWNAGVSLTRAPYVCVVGQDDTWAASFLERVWPLLPRAAAVGAGSSFIDESGARIDPKLPFNHRSNLWPDGGTFRVDPSSAVEIALRYGNVLGEPTSVVFSRRQFERLGGYCSDFEHAADLDFHLKLATAGPFYYIAENLTARRRHRSALSVSNVRSGAAARDRIRLFEAYQERLEPAERSLVSASLFGRDVHDALVAVRNREAARAFRSIRRAARSARGTDLSAVTQNVIDVLQYGRKTRTRLSLFRCT